MDGLEMCRRALGNTERIVAAVRDDQVGDPTPCAGWDVRALIEHLIDGNWTFAALAAGGGMPESVAYRHEYATGDRVADYRHSVQLTLEAWEKPGVMDASLDSPFGPMLGSRLIRLHGLEQLVHGWDLAKATGQGTTLGIDLVEVAYALATQLPMNRIRSLPNPLFGPEVPVGGGATLQDRLLGLLGRNP